MKLRTLLKKMFRKPLTIYYAHSLRKYNTRTEKIELYHLKKKFPKARIVNPKEFSYEGEKMDYCFEFIKNKVDLVVFSNFKGFVGKGVFDEISFALSEGIPVKYLYRGELHNNFRSILFNPRDWAIYYAKVELEEKT